MVSSCPNAASLFFPSYYAGANLRHIKSATKFKYVYSAHEGITNAQILFYSTHATKCVTGHRSAFGRLAGIEQGGSYQQEYIVGF